MSEHDYEWALVRRHEHCDRVRFWWWLWHTADTIDARDLLQMDDPTIWDHWRDFNEINKLLEIDHPASPFDVAHAIAHGGQT